MIYLGLDQSSILTKKKKKYCTKISPVIKRLSYYSMEIIATTALVTVT